MSYLFHNQQKFNDIVFENRNKNYGAYAIRSAYGNTVFKSLLFVSLFACSIAGLAYFLSRKAEAPAIAVEQILPTEIVTIFETEKPKPVEPEAARPPLKPDPAPANSSAIGTLVNDTMAVNTRSQSTAEDPQIVTTLSIQAGGTESGPGPGNGTITGVKGPGPGIPDDEIPEDFGVDTPPEFAGGINALLRFVSSHLRYPEIAVERYKEGTVYVKFVVDEKGKVGNIMLRNNLGFGLDEEARRVVSMIPDFKTPAKIKGQPVKVYYSLPIRFKMR